MSQDLTAPEPAAGDAEPAAGAGAAPAAGFARRAVLRAAGMGSAVAAVGVAAAACGSSANGSVANPVEASAASTSGPLFPVSAIALHGGQISGSLDGGIVVTQPSAGVYKAFSSTCTHQGCTVATVTDNQIQCPCHGSVFSAVDGSVINGPATAPLPARSISVKGSEIYAG